MHLSTDVPPPARAEPSAASPSAQSLSAVFDALPTQGGGPAGARLLSDNLDAWNARWDMVSQATTSIDAVYFSLEKDVFGHAFLGTLLEKQLSGVQVRVMTDAMADTFGQRGFKMPLRGKDYLQELVHHGAKAYVFHPLWQRPAKVFRGDYSLLASNHDKLLVVDGQRSITGGRNIGIDYFADPHDRPHAWRDMDVALEGAGPAKGLTAALNDELKQGNVARPVHEDRLGNWAKRDLELLATAKMMDVWLKAPAFSEAQKAQLRADPAARAKLAAELVDEGLALVPPSRRRAPNAREQQKLTELAAQLVEQLEARGSHARYQASRLPERATEAKILDQTSAAGTRVNGIAPALAALTDAASKRIIIQNPYVVLTESMLASLEKASQRGVEITILTNSPLSTDSAVTQAFFLEDWQTILARCPTARIFVATGERKLHGKSAVIDDDQALVTTYNLDLLSGYVNSEVGAVVKSRELAEDLLGELEKDRAAVSNGFLEYRIEKDANGEAVLKDGKPIPVFGPENHLPPELIEEYSKKRKLWGQTLRENLGYFEPLRHPKPTE